MATDPAFAATPRCAITAVSTTNTNRDGTGTLPTLFTAGGSGSKVEEIMVKSTSDPADSIVTIFISDGSTTYLFDEIDLGNPAAASTTVISFRDRRAYANLFLPSGYSLKVGITVAPTAGVMNVFATGGDF